MQAYNARLYRASAVMLGVACEAAVLEAAEGLAAILNDTEKQQFLDQMGSPKLNMVAKFNVVSAEDAVSHGSFTEAGC